MIALRHVKEDVHTDQLKQVLTSFGGKVRDIAYDSTFRLWRVAFSHQHQAEQALEGIERARALAAASDRIGKLQASVVALGADLVATCW